MEYEPVDDSGSIDVVDEDALLPIGESPGALADDPDLDTEDDFQAFEDSDNEDWGDALPDEVPGKRLSETESMTSRLEM
ncbi:hypothetical protein [Nocardioides speluncae]|uniref:hypothetical protein n=1 Tax=Nocardioides speluncae TaxID=2670337 RepID=UPI000D691570|nr:hypothetical protein [Nocardioides speluncae]